MKKYTTKNAEIEQYYKTVQSYKEVHYLPGGWAAVGLILAFIVSDYTFISQLLEYYFVDEAWRGILASVVLAILADVSPSILAACIMVEPKKKVHYAGIASISAMLVALFSFLGYVRLNSADLIFSISSTSLGSAVNQATDTSLSAGQHGMSWLFVILPIATSILSFIISIVSDSNVKKEYTDKLAAKNFDDQITALEVDKIEIQDTMERNFEDYVNDLKQLAIDNHRTDAMIVKDKLKLVQAMASGDPQAADNIFAKKVE